MVVKPTIKLREKDLKAIHEFVKENDQVVREFMEENDLTTLEDFITYCVENQIDMIIEGEA